MSQQRLTLDAGGERVSALLDAPANPRAVYACAHGAGAGMEHPFLKAVATGLAERGIATLRYQFPYMEKGVKRVDPPKVAHAVVRAAIAAAAEHLPELPLFAGGKSFGGRMTSQAQAAEPLAGVRGLVFLGFPLHAPGKPSTERGEHLAAARVPMLFLQGTRDELASVELLRPLVAQLGATLRLFDDADHSFRARSRLAPLPQRKGGGIMAEVLDAAAGWIDATASAPRPGS